MNKHNKKLLKKYKKEFKSLVKGTGFENKSVEYALERINEVPENIREDVINYGGGYANHKFFKEQGFKFDGSKYKDTFKREALNHFGCGWAWICEAKKSTEIITTKSEESPLMWGLTPIVGLDLWEHAYIEDCTREQYIENFIKSE